jgi:hypothetical protein
MMGCFGEVAEEWGVLECGRKVTWLSDYSYWYFQIFHFRCLSFVLCFGPGRTHTDRKRERLFRQQSLPIRDSSDLLVRLFRMPAYQQHRFPQIAMYIIFYKRRGKGNRA